MKVYSVLDKKFRKLGAVVDCPFIDFLTEKANAIEIPETGCSYMASVPEFESQETLAYYKDVFGDMEVQLGYCWGRNDTLNALEWHKSSEIHCALEDMILLLGDKNKMKGDTFNSKHVKAFLVKKGQSVELYQSTLHFCPANPDGKVFKNVVILPKGTNTPLENKGKDKKLVAKNKWLICHPECKKQVDLGRQIGIEGKNIKL